MNTSLMLAILHLLTMAMAFSAIHNRAKALKKPLTSPEAIRAVLSADNMWGIASVILLSSGLLRAFAGFEKGTAYYMHNAAFHAKLTMTVVILGLEVWPMLTLLGWRKNLKQGQPVDSRRALVFAKISLAQMILLSVMLVAAAMMTRGLGAF